MSKVVRQVNQVNRDSVSASCLSPAVCSGNISRDHIPSPCAETASGNNEWKKKICRKNGKICSPPNFTIVRLKQRGSPSKGRPLAAGLTEPRGCDPWHIFVGITALEIPGNAFFSTFQVLHLYIYIINCALNTICT